MNRSILTAAQREHLLENGRQHLAPIDADRDPIDFKPVVKLFTPEANAIWLLTELIPLLLAPRKHLG